MIQEPVRRAFLRSQGRPYHFGRHRQDILHLLLPGPTESILPLTRASDLA